MNLLSEALTDIFRSTADETLWRTLEDGGFTLLGIDESHGGSGGSITDLMTCLRLAGYHGAGVPIAESAALAAPLLASVGAPLPGGPMGVAVVPADARVAPSVRWAPVCTRVVVLAGDTVLSVGPDAFGEHEEPDFLGTPRASVDLTRAERLPGGPGAAAEIYLRGALSRAVMIAGAAQRALELTIDHAGARTQFGRPLSAFQAVQQQIAEAAAELAAVRIAADTAVEVVAQQGFDSPMTRFAVAAAKSQGSRTVEVLSRITHQVHGAIGTTAEHPLGRSTRPMRLWAREYGTAAYWHAQLHRDTRGIDADNLWAAVAGVSPEPCG